MHSLTNAPPLDTLALFVGDLALPPTYPHLAPMPASRVCPVPGCPALIPAGVKRCATHQAEHERRRGSPTARGYGTQHRALRDTYLPALPSGTVRCVTCGVVLTDTLDLGHTDDRRGYLGPQCPRCNRGAGGARAGHDPATR